MTLTAALLVATVTSCSGSSATRTHTVSVAPGVTVTLSDGSPVVTATAEPTAGSAVTRPLTVGGRSLPGALAVLAPPQYLKAHGPLPVGGALISFHVDPRQVPPGTKPFLASLDPATGLWVPVVSSYNEATGDVSARVSHFSVWAPLDWVTSRIAAVVKGALLSLFGLAGTGAAPSCSGDTIPVTDSRPHAGIGACAQADGAADAVAKVVDERPYPVDLDYPAGARVNVPDADPFEQLGEEINNLASEHDTVLLPGGAEADTTVSLAVGQTTSLRTVSDGEALLLGILGTAVTIMTKISGGLAISTAKALLDALGKAQCLRDAVDTADTASLLLSTAQNIGSVAFECVAAAAKGVSDVIFSVASIVASLAVELIASVWGAIDTAIGNGYHELTLQRPAIAGAGVFAGVWGGHERVIDIHGDGTFTGQMETYRFCGVDPPPCDTPQRFGDVFSGKLISVTGRAAVGVITSTTDLSMSPVGRVALTFSMPSDSITFGGLLFCGPKAPGGYCGA